MRAWRERIVGRGLVPRSRHETPLHERSEWAARARPTIALLALIALTGACRCTPKLESAAGDLPITVAAAKKQHAPPDVVVTVERKVTPKGGGSCGHSPLCLILLPVLIYEEMFPEKYDEVVIVDHGKEAYRASFTTRGDFLQARTTTSEGLVHDFRQLSLKELGKRVVVEAARSPSPGAKPEAVPLAPQAQLIEAYTQAMKRPGNAQCGALVVEAMSWLAAEADAFAKGQMSRPDAEWPDECKAEVAKMVCPKGERLRKQEHDIIAAAGTAPGGPGPLTTTEVIRHCIAKTVWDTDKGGQVPAPGTLDDAQAAPFTKAFVTGVCTRKISASDYTNMRQVSAPWNRKVDAAIDTEPACRERGPAEFFSMLRYKPVAREALDAALQTAWASDIVSHMTVKEHEEVLIKALDDKRTTEAVLRMLRKPHAPQYRELKTGGAAFARLYARGPPSSFCVDDEERVWIIEDVILGLPVNERAAALQALRAWKNQDDVIGAARRALGDTEPVEFSTGSMTKLRAQYRGAICNDADVVVDLLDLAGCKGGETGSKTPVCPAGGAKTRQEREAEAETAHKERGAP